MFKWLKHLGHTARWEYSRLGGLTKRCSCNAVLIHHPGVTEMSEIRRKGF